MVWGLTLSFRFRRVIWAGSVSYTHLLCVLVLTVSVIPAASALEGEAARAADTLSTLGLIDSTYNLDAPATRAQAAVLLVHLAGADAPARCV